MQRTIRRCLKKPKTRKCDVPCQDKDENTKKTHNITAKRDCQNFVHIFGTATTQNAEQKICGNLKRKIFGKSDVCVNRIHFQLHFKASVVI